MTRNVFDLLDGYVDESAAPENASPLSARRIRARTMQRLSPRKAQRRFRSLAAAAVLAAALSITALAAANTPGVSKWFHAFFTPNGTLNAAQSEAIDRMGAVMEDAVSSNGATLTPLAILVDENVCYLRLRIEAPAGTVLGALPDGWSYKLYGAGGKDELARFEPMDMTPYIREITNPDGSKARKYSFGCGIAEFDLPDSDPTDNVIETVLRFTADQAMAEQGVRFNDGTEKRLTISGLWVMSPELDFTEVFRADFSLSIGSRFESYARELDCTDAVWTDERGVTYTLDRVLLSPLSLSFRYISDLPMPTPPGSVTEWRGMEIGPDILPQPNAFALIRNDGTVIDCTPMETGAENTGYSISGIDWQPFWARWDYVVFDEPLDLSEIACVRYGDCLIPLRGKQ